MKGIGPRNGLLAKIFTVLAGGVLAQIIAFASTPWVTRLYTPTEFGVFSNVSVFAGFLMPLLSLSLPMAVVLTRGKGRGRAFAKGTMLLSCLGGLVLLGLSLVVWLSGAEATAYAIAMATLFGLGIALQESIMYLYIKEQYYSIRAGLLVIQALIVAGLKIALGYIDSSANSLIWSSIIGYSLVNLAAVLHLQLFSVKFNRLNFYAALKSKTQFIKFRTPQNLLSNLNLLLPVSVLTYFFSAGDAGLYALARTVIILPATILGKSITDVLYPKMVDMVKGKQHVSQILNKSVLALSLITVLPLVILEWQGDYLFDLVFGDKWSGSADYAKWVMVWVFFNIINKPHTALIPVFNLEKKFLKNSVSNFILTCAGLAVGVFWIKDPVQSIKWMSLLTVVPQLMIVVIVMSRVRDYEKK